MATKKVLFISHSASRSGAPMLLLYFLQWLKVNSKIEFEVLLLQNGELSKDFDKIAKTWSAQDILKTNSFLYKIKRKLRPVPWEHEIRHVLKKIHSEKFEFAYGNTTNTLPWILELKSIFKIKTVIAIHELSHVLNAFFASDYLTKNLSEPDLIIAGSGAVGANLIKSYGVSQDRVKVVHSFIKTSIYPADRIVEIKKELGLSTGDFIIGGAGTPEWRKGTDLIIPLLKNLVKNYPDVPVKLIWIGGSEHDDEIKKIKYDAEKCHLTKNLIFVNAGKSYLDYMNIFDVFLLLSREDPFPLVALEAALLKKPILAFENAGGAVELLRTGGGYLIPYLDLEKLADKIVELYKDPAMIENCGVNGSKEVKEHYDAAIIAPKLLDVINSFV